METGNSESLKFKYLFSNLFFGYCGLNEIENADQIQGIAYARNLKLDSKGLKNDYSLFVSGKFDLFPTEIKTLVETQNHIFAKKHINMDDDTNYFEDDFAYRSYSKNIYIF